MKKQDSVSVNISFIAGLFTGALNKFITHPIDTIKAKISVD